MRRKKLTLTQLGYESSLDGSIWASHFKEKNKSLLFKQLLVKIFISYYLQILHHQYGGKSDSSKKVCYSRRREVQRKGKNIDRR